MGDYHTLARRTMEIILPEGHIIPPEGCIIAGYVKIKMHDPSDLLVS